MPSAVNVEMQAAVYMYISEEFGPIFFISPNSLSPHHYLPFQLHFLKTSVCPSAPKLSQALLQGLTSFCGVAGLGPGVGDSAFTVRFWPLEAHTQIDEKELLSLKTFPITF